MADGTFGLALLTDPVGTFHTKQVVPTGYQGGNDLALKAH